MRAHLFVAFTLGIASAAAGAAPLPRVLPSSMAPGILADPATSVLFSEDFEGVVVPNGRWDAADREPLFGFDYWGVVRFQDDHEVWSGFNSAWCAGVTDRSDGRYDHGMDAVLVNRSGIPNDGGPVVVTFHYWLDAENDHDYLSLDTSCDGYAWVSTAIFTGTSGGWQVAQVVVSGCSQLWVRFVFQSDAQGNARGAYVDDVRVEGVGIPGPDLAWATPPGWFAPVVVSRSPGHHQDETPYVGEAAYLDLAVVNQGGQTTQPCRAWVSIDGNPTFDVAVPTLAPTEVHLIEDLAYVFQAAGSHRIDLVADPLQTSQDQNLQNNSYQRYVQAATEPRADLLVTSLGVLPATAISGEAVQVTASVRNAGLVYSSLSWFGIYWNRPAPPAPGTPADSFFLLPALAPGETRAVAFSRAASGNVEATTYVAADIFGTEQESNEQNNVAGPVTCRWRALDLVARDLGSGDAVGVRWRLVSGHSFRLERAPAAAGSFLTLGETADSVWLDLGLPENEPWRYRLTALRGGVARGAPVEKIATPRLPLVLIHGFVLNPPGGPLGLSDTVVQWGAWRTLLQDPAAPTARFEHVWTPRLPGQDGIEPNQARVAAYLDARLAGLARWNLDEFGYTAPPGRIQAVGYSAGGLYLRRLMHLHRGLVRRAILLATPNGGAPAADLFALGLLAAGYRLTDPVRGCDSRPLVCELTPAYVQNVFNPSAPRDPTPGTTYEAIAGVVADPFRERLWGPGDGYVPVSSVYHPAVFPADFPHHLVPFAHDRLRREPEVLFEEVYPILTGRARGFPGPDWGLATTLPAPSATLAASRTMLGTDWQMIAAYADSVVAGATCVLLVPGSAGPRVRARAIGDGAPFDLALRDPDGVKWDSTCAGLEQTCGFARWEGDAVLAGAALDAAAARAGAWSVEITGRGAPGSRTRFWCAVEESTASSLRPDPAYLHTNPGETAWVRARLDSAGTPIPGVLSVQAELPAGLAWLPLADDGLHGDGAAGDGLHGGALNGVAEGVHPLLFAAELPGGRGRRLATALLEVGRVDREPPRVQLLTPNGPGAVMMAGGNNLIRWSATDSAGVDSVQVWFSLEDGSSHLRVAGGLPGEGETLWRAPDTLALRQGRVRIVAFDRSSNWAEAVSEYPVFVAVVVGAGAAPRSLEFCLAGANPLRQAARLEARLPAASPVDLAIFDVAGRRVRRLMRGPRAAGIHVATWALDDDAGRAVRNGIYWARLQAGERKLSCILVVLR